MEQKEETWSERFDEMERNHGWLPEHKEGIKSFIQNEIEAAEKRGREWGLALPLDLRNKALLRAEGKSLCLKSVKKAIEELKLEGDLFYGRISSNEVLPLLEAKLDSAAPSE